MKRLGMSVAAVVLVALTGGTRGGEKADNPLDKDFLIKVATCSNAEIQIGKLADSRAQSAKVKEFATMLVKDHQASYDRMAELLKTRKIGVAAGFEKENREEVKRLGKLEGAEFDRAFLNSMITEHKKAISMFENQAKNGKEEDVRSYATETLPTLRRHLSQAQELVKSVP